MRTTLELHDDWEGRPRVHLVMVPGADEDGDVESTDLGSAFDPHTIDRVPPAFRDRYQTLVEEAERQAFEAEAEYWERVCDYQEAIRGDW